MSMTKGNMQHQIIKFSKFVISVSLMCIKVYAGNGASIIAQVQESNPRKDLCEYFNIGGIERLPKDVQVIISKEILKRDQWWYKKGIVQHDCYVRSVAFNSHGTLLATSSNDTKVHIVTTDGVKLHTLKHNKQVWDAVFNPQGTLLATASLDHAVCLWDMQGRKMHTLKHFEGIKSVVFNNKGTLLAAVGEKGTVSLWNMQGHELCRLECGNVMHFGEEYIHKVRFHPHQPYILIAGYGFWYTALVNFENEHIIPEEMILRHDGNVLDAAFNPEGTLFASASKDTTVCLWNMQGKKLCTLLHNKPVKKVLFNPQGTQVATATDFCIRLWDLEGNNLQSLYNVNVMHSIAFNPQGTLLAVAANDDNELSLWDMDGKKLKSLHHRKNVGSLAFSPTQMAIATRSIKQAHIWQQHNEPTFAQLLMRIALQDYARMQCLKREPLPNDLTTEALLSDAEFMLNLKKDELACIWKTLPEALQKSILKTVIYRSKLSKNYLEIKEGWFGMYIVNHGDDQ